MIAGAGMNVGGAGMLRTRRRDISIKPNRKLDRKSSRGMIYENEELRLRTIHINAEVEQGQNDIKKLRRENEQLRREIWGLRDEYDKLEEILKQQKLKDNSDNSDSNTNYSESEDDDSNEEDDKTDVECKQEDHIKDCENSKLSPEEMHRFHVNFDELSTVVEEDETTKGKEIKNINSLSCDPNHEHILSKDIIQKTLPYYSIPYDPSSNSGLYATYSAGFTPECPFIFPTPNLSYLEKSPEDTILIPPCPPMYANDVSPTNNADAKPVSTSDFHSVSTGFPSVSDLENSSSEASVQTRSTKVASSSNLSNINAAARDNATVIPKGVEESVEKNELDLSRKPKHFFAPLQSQQKFGSMEPQQMSDISCKKGSADICIKETNLDNHQPTFFSSENLFVNSDEKRSSASNLVKSLSCHDLSKSDKSSAESKTKLAKSENALDSSGSFRTRVDITLKSPKPPTPTTPEVPKLPSFDSKLFTNQYHQHFEQYRNYIAQAIKKPLTVQMPDPPGFCPGFYGFLKIPPETDRKGKTTENLEHYQALLLNGKVKSAKDIQVTSFETPSPRTVQIPPLTPYDLNLLYSKLPGFTPDVHGVDFYHNLPLLTKDGAVICPNGPGLRVQCETCLKKLPAQVQTPGDSGTETDRKKPKKQTLISSSGSSEISSQRRKERLKKQISVTSSDIPETPVDSSAKRMMQLKEKDESRSSSSAGESPRKDYKRMSIYFNPKKRSSVTSVKTTKSLSLDINKAKGCVNVDGLDSAVNFDEDKLGINNVGDGKGKKKHRKNSTSSESVPWCACWGNGCI